ncbi:hypothetical protein CSHISOI_11474 [Colletotrichum shisoi]|uniref:Uncharacterized protein n=1 Tax=Colletotrichum shisoi TaxID=2078593 RepID=A0A5Q4BAM4_9PEZI|nr:hypothetical protein CSHISOI_11474 [Colletotrichum shisoi]
MNKVYRMPKAHSSNDGKAKTSDGGPLEGGDLRPTPVPGGVLCSLCWTVDGEGPRRKCDEDLGRQRSPK